ncbi:hypothetical protein ABID52_002865 [Fictibacillus halophilus]|uniref:Uncharacterized protein n=1 Tax=Fictibacillus halophilus TaxID=1610490 RepID=A0ABV2LL24_9BACL|nr:hypothetical protein [Fictibacillus halophilus]
MESVIIVSELFLFSSFVLILFLRKLSSKNVSTTLFLYLIGALPLLITGMNSQQDDLSTHLGLGLSLIYTWIVVGIAMLSCIVLLLKAK